MREYPCDDFNYNYQSYLLDCVTPQIDTDITYVRPYGQTHSALDITCHF